ncbi:MAG TPA: NAD(+)/NADH kinase [Candidatus Deferrimicrobium sp.]|nr:NAD(+)/NADH kinase [Candidatus Deferrimicrobium sp.]
MRFGLIANVNREGARETLEAAVAWSRQFGHELFFSEELRESVSKKGNFVERSKLASEVDVIISMGGDGTFLSAGRAVGDRGTPLLGINLGSLGFLTQSSQAQLTKALDAIVAGKYQIEERMLLRVAIAGKSELEHPYALNDVVVDNGPVSRLIDITLFVNGEDIVTYRADGLVIATATGSTAYALAVGGPILHPKMEAIVAAPIASFSLNTRPMVFSADDALELRISSSHGVAGLTLDGQVSAPLTDMDRVIIRKAGFRLKLVTFPQYSFYKLLRSKLHWGVAPKPSKP